MKKLVLYTGSAESGQYCQSEDEKRGMPYLATATGIYLIFASIPFYCFYLVSVVESEKMKLAFVMLGLLTAFVLLMSFATALKNKHDIDNTPISKGTQALAVSIENDPAWVQVGYRLVNGRTGTALWIANGIDFIDYYPKVDAFNSREKFFLHSAIQVRLAKNATLPKGV